MAREITFAGKQAFLPGVYTQIKSGIQNPPLDQSFGNVLVIDKDPNSLFGFGGSIAGELTNGANAVYQMNNIGDFHQLVRGGELWDYAKGWFRPAGPSIPGASNIFYVRALTTTAAQLALTFDSTSTLTLKTKVEGYAGEGIEGDETLATITVQVTGTGGAGDTVTLNVDLGSGDVAIAAATLDGTETVSEIAQALLDDLNADYATHRFTGVRVNDTLTITAPANSGAAANAYTANVAVTGTVTATTTSPFAGGVDGSILTNGMGVTLSAGVVDAAKYIFSFWRGTYTGMAADGIAYDETNAADTEPELVAQSPEVANLEELQAWMTGSAAFNSLFVISAINISGVGAFAAADLTALAGNNLFSGASQTYNTARVTEILDAVTELDYTFVFSTDGGADAYSADNAKILDHLFNAAKFQKYMIVGGGDTVNEYASQSVANASLFSSSRAILVHGGVNVFSRANGDGKRPKSAIYKAAHVLGRIAGLQPQTPVTFKSLDYLEERHILKTSERIDALKNGVLVTAFTPEIGAFTVVEGVNTLNGNLNNFAVNADGTSYLISVERISAQLNKELQVNILRDLLGNQRQGPNRATLSDEVIRTYVKNYLTGREATDTDDNLILSYGSVTVTTQGTNSFVKYEFTPNFEKNKIFVTGFIVDPNQ